MASNDLTDTGSLSTVNEIFNDAHSESTSVSSGVGHLSENSSSYRFLSYVFTTGQKITSNLIYTTAERHYYSFNSHNKDADTYKCVSCNSRVHLRKDEKLIQK